VAAWAAEAASSRPHVNIGARRCEIDGIFNSLAADMTGTLACSVAHITARAAARLQICNAATLLAR
jgi:hypothetical protein